MSRFSWFFNPNSHAPLFQATAQHPIIGGLICCLICYHEPTLGSWFITEPLQASLAVGQKLLKCADALQAEVNLLSSPSLHPSFIPPAEMGFLAKSTGGKMSQASLAAVVTREKLGGHRSAFRSVPDCQQPPWPVGRYRWRPRDGQPPVG